MLFLMEYLTISWDWLFKRDMFEEVNELIGFASQIIVVKKTIGDLHNCIDPYPFKKALIEEQYPKFDFHSVFW